MFNVNMHIYRVSYLNTILRMLLYLILVLCICITHMHYFLYACILITSCMSAGDLPYSELGNTVILSRVMAGYRLDCPQGCTENMYG